MNFDELEHIFEELKAVYQNLKAEVIVAELQKNSKITNDDIVIHNKSAFKRSHRRDILEIGNVDDGTLHLNLSRNGLYDQLPEGLFHSRNTGKTPIPYPQLRQIYKKEEQDARHFFLPLENEFFIQKLNIENKEQEFLNDFLNLNDDFLIEFWKVDKSIPKNYLLKLLKLLPYSYKIAGDLELTRLCLESILNKKIRLKKTYKSNQINRKRSLDDIEQILGVTFTLNNDYDNILQPAIEFEIREIQEDEIDNFTKKDGALKFINIFYDYFIPLEIEIITKFIVDSKDNFTLNTEHEPIMGITTQI